MIPKLSRIIFDCLPKPTVKDSTANAVPTPIALPNLCAVSNNSAIWSSESAIPNNKALFALVNNSVSVTVPFVASLNFSNESAPKPTFLPRFNIALSKSSTLCADCADADIALNPETIPFAAKRAPPTLIAVFPSATNLLSTLETSCSALFAPLILKIKFNILSSAIVFLQQMLF